MSNPQIATDEDFLQNLSENTKSFWVGRPGKPIEILENPTPLEFMKAVSQYTPVILRGVIDDWRIMRDEDPVETLRRHSSSEIEVNFTTHGNADSVESSTDLGRDIFIYPAAVTIPFNSFLDMLEHHEDGDAVPYLSEQNDNLRRSFPDFIEEIEPSIALADSVFGAEKLEAVNVWLGDERSVTSLHKDYFENMYAVVKGEKTFHLFPPTDTVFLPEATYPTFRYELKSEFPRPFPSRHIRKEDIVLQEVSESPTISWIGMDPTNQNHIEKFPQSNYASCLECKLRVGEVLYIPAMWYHRVSQSCTTLAINFWYDMEFDHR